MYRVWVVLERYRSEYEGLFRVQAHVDNLQNWRWSQESRGFLKSLALESDWQFLRKGGPWRDLRKITKTCSMKRIEGKMGLYIMALTRPVMMECKIMSLCWIYSKWNWHSRWYLFIQYTFFWVPIMCQSVWGAELSRSSRKKVDSCSCLLWIDT